MENKFKIDKEKIFDLLKNTTWVWLAIIVLIVISTITPSSEKYTDYNSFIENLNFPQFNNWGDFFAGFFSPLAFLWLGYGILIQRDEFGKLTESVDAQKEEMERQSEQFQAQTGHMAKQINLIMSQDLANWYGKYSDNMSKLYNIDLNELDEKFATINEYRTTVEKFESLENILNYNNQIEKYFFSEEKVEMKDIMDMLKIDYDVMHRKKINTTKMLYVKMSILKLLKDKYHALPIDLPENININNFISRELEEKMNTLISSTTKTTAEDIATVVFDHITTDEVDAIKYIKVSCNGQ